MNKNNNRGFTLIELIIAMSILSSILFIGYKVINKINFFTKDQQYISNNQSTANLVNTYLSQDIEQSNSVSNREIINEDTYKYIISKNNGSIEYVVTLEKKRGKDIYSLSRIEDKNSIEIVSNQLRNDEIPFTITPKENRLYEIKVSYRENKRVKEYLFNISSRISNNDGSIDNDDVTNDIKPGIDDMPQLPSDIGVNTHYIGFWMADWNLQKKDNVYTWIDSNYSKGISTKEKNDISANIRPGNEGASEYAKIEDTKVSGSITGKTDINNISIYVSKGTTVENFEIRGGQGSGSITISDNSGKVDLSGGANDGKWYKCKVNGHINTFEIISGSLSINKEIVNSGYILIVYGETSEELGDADIIFEYNRSYENAMNTNQYNMSNIIKVKNTQDTYTIVDTKRDNAFSSSIQTRISNYSHESWPNILLMTEKSIDRRINSVYGIDIKKIEKVILTLEGNISIIDTSGIREIIPNRQYELTFTSGTNFDRHIKISNLEKGETGMLKVNLICN